MVPVSLKILDAILARIPVIKTANGYNYDIKEYGREFKTHAEVKLFPALFVADAVERREVQTGMYEVQLSVFIYGWVSSPDRRTAVRKLAQDIEKMVYVDETWGGLAEFTHVIGTQTDRSLFFNAPIGWLEFEILTVYQIERGVP